MKSRPDLEGTCAEVTGLCYKTKRVGIQVQGGARIFVLIEKLTPLADDEDRDGGIPYDESYFVAVQIVILEFVQTQGAAAGEVGVGVDNIVAAMATKAVMASLDDIRTAVVNLVVKGDCYTTVDDCHFLAV